ncbi:MAG: rod shape-determining protein MreD [Acidobacteriota bacterium]|nr:rod shape-determining protein MreD [Acidobacteriota bacterium]
MKAVWIALATTAALALQTTVAHAFMVHGSVPVDLVLVVVVYVALSSGPFTGLLAGTFAGLAQDALSGGIIGIGGLADTLVGFLAGVVGTQFIVTQPLTRMVVFFGATVVRAILFMGLYALLGLRHFPSPYAAVAIQGVGNAVVGVVAFEIVEVLPGAIERRRLRGPRLRR